MRSYYVREEVEENTLRFLIHFFNQPPFALYVEMNIGKHLGGGPPVIPLPATRNGRSGFKKLTASAPHE